ncbi:MAG: hypothetical protein ACI80V_003722 [Rhodothermales bacterium]|jgi:hypothetical protein
MTTSAGTYFPLHNLRLDSVYPTVEGYKGVTAVGLRADLSDQLVFSRIKLAASYSPAKGIAAGERWHAGLTFNYLNIAVEATHNRSDFYDLFGPTKTSRKGNSLSVRYKKNLLFDEPITLDYTLQVAGYANLETVPEYQNVAAPFDKLLSASAGLNYANMRRSLGAIENELGTSASLGIRSNLVNGELFPRLQAEVECGVLLPINHSSLWLRASAGQSLAAQKSDPFAKFYFGGFGNNWVDHLGVKRFRDSESFPGLEIN